MPSKVPITIMQKVTQRVIYIPREGHDWPQELLSDDDALPSLMAILRRRASLAAD